MIRGGHRLLRHGSAITQCVQDSRVAAFSSPQSKAAEDWPVIIVGAGAAGLTLSALLAQLGVRNLVLERAAQLTQHPQVLQAPIWTVHTEAIRSNRR